MVRFALLALALAAPPPAAAQSHPAPPPTPIETSTATGPLTRAVEDADRHVPSSTRPAAWVDTTVAPRVHTWMPRPHWELLSLTLPEDFRGGLLYTGGVTVWPWVGGTTVTPRGGRSTVRSTSRPARP